MAADYTTPASDRPAHARDSMNQPQADRLHSAAKASDIVGMTVNNYQDDKLGSVEDLAVDLESGRRNPFAPENKYKGATMAASLFWQE